MSSERETMEQENWQDMKAAVGTVAMHSKQGRGSLALDELLLNIKAVGFDSMVCQTAIQTAEDMEQYLARGYDIDLTETEFRNKFNIAPSCVWYTPSLAQNCIYFNPATLAAAPFPIKLFVVGIYSDPSGLYAAIESREDEVAKQDYAGSILVLPDAMRMEYFNLLLDQKGSDIPGLYELFFSNYLCSDYGFGGIRPSVMEKIFASKTEQERSATAEKMREFP